MANTLWVIKQFRNGHVGYGKYAKGDKYTKDLQKAELFVFRDDAQDSCSEPGERPVKVKVTVRLIPPKKGKKR